MSGYKLVLPDQHEIRNRSKPIKIQIKEWLISLWWELHYSYDIQNFTWWMYKFDHFIMQILMSCATLIMLSTSIMGTYYSLSCTYSLNGIFLILILKYGDWCLSWFIIFLSCKGNSTKDEKSVFSAYVLDNSISLNLSDKFSDPSYDIFKYCVIWLQIQFNSHTMSRNLFSFNIGGLVS